MKTGTLYHVKTKRLKRELKLPLWGTAGLLETLWQVALDSADDGRIGKHSNEEIAAAIEWEDDADKLISALVKCGWLDEHPHHRLVIHDWIDHCPNYIKDRLEKRERRDSSRKQRTYVHSEGDTSEPCPPRVGQPSDEQGTSPSQSELTKVTKPNPARPNPAHPSQTQPSSSSSSPKDQPTWEAEPTWEEEEEELRRLGSKTPAATVKLCRERELTPAELRGFRLVFERERDRWAIPGEPGAEFGALHMRLTNAVPLEDPGDLERWRKPNEAYASRARRTSAEQRGAGKAQRSIRQDVEARELDRQQAAELEQRFGGALDRMAKPERDALAAEVLKGVLLQKYKTGGAVGTVRELLLDRMAGETPAETAKPPPARKPALRIAQTQEQGA